MPPAKNIGDVGYFAYQNALAVPSNPLFAAARAAAGLSQFPPLGGAAHYGGGGRTGLFPAGPAKNIGEDGGHFPHPWPEPRMHVPPPAPWVTPGGTGPGQGGQSGVSPSLPPPPGVDSGGWRSLTPPGPEPSTLGLLMKMLMQSMVRTGRGDPSVMADWKTKLGQLGPAGPFPPGLTQMQNRWDQAPLASPWGKMKQGLDPYPVGGGPATMGRGTPNTGGIFA